ncbi:MAG: SCP2 sterol-binding domain-containing protein [Proteobacteria bacterium]|nr:SCP2 sterol-binding domain-containing protein [Pseudomonadota bacterium]
MTRTPEVRIVDRDQMNLLGLMLGGILKTNLSYPKKAALTRKMVGRLGVTAGRMSLTLDFNRDSISIIRGLDGPLRASIRGSLDILLRVSLGCGPIRPFLSGELSFSGNPLFALRALPLFRIEVREEDSA